MIKIIAFSFIGIMCFISFYASGFKNLYSLGLAVINIALLCSSIAERKKKKN